MSAEDHLVDSLLSAVLDGTPVDWDALESAAGNERRRYFRRLRIVAQIGHTHRAAGEHPPAFEESLSPGQTWGPFRLVERVGCGSFGEVWRAWDPHLDREVALKLLPATPETEPQATDVLQEARLLARLRHANVATVHGAERYDNRVGLWMEYVRGENLEQVLRARGPLRPAEVYDVGLQMCGALSAVHRAGVLHRDIKASNVRRTTEGRIVLLDFGSGRERHDTRTANDLTGTPLYLAPELFDGAPATVQSDIYSLGVLLYHLLSGTYPVTGTTLQDVRRAHAAGHVVPVVTARPGTPRGLASVIDRAVNSAPAARFASCEAMDAALRSARAGPRRLAAVAAAALAVVLAGAIGGLGLWRAASDATTPSTPRFQPRDLVLITQFENRTGESIFDGAVEYALERELSGSAVVGLVPPDRIEDALDLMRRPRDTVIDRAIGREVSLRDGHIKALLAGRVERFGNDYVITALLIDPASDVVVATLSEQVSGQEAILAALRRQASRVRVALGEQRDRMAGADPAVEQASTRSLRAFQLYNQSYRLGRERRWPAALEIARQTVEADPDFASGWIWLAWATRNAEFGDSPLLGYGVPPTERDQENRETLRPFVERALALANGLADWERLWIRASASTLLGDLAAAVPLYEALLKLRPEHFYAANNLVTALRRLNRPDDLDRATQVLADQRPNDFGFNLEAATRLLARPGLSSAVNQQAATPYLDRLNALRAQAEARTPVVGRWMAFMPAYRAWQAGDVRGTLDVIDQLRAAPRQSPGVGVGAVDYYLALGRLAQASALVDSVDRPQEKSMMRLLVADATGDAGELRRVLESAPVPENTGALVHIRAGLPRQAQEIVRQPSRDPLVEGINELARGELALAAGREVAGLERLRVGVSMLHMNGGGSREYYIGCESLATELERLGRRDESIDVLEGCATNRVRSQRPDAFAGFWWMRLNLHLADVYRRAGRAPEARTIEQRLRPLLRLADEGFPLLQQLNSR